MRVLVVGTGSPSADLVAEILNANGIQCLWVDQVKMPKLNLIRRFDVVYGVYLQTCSRYVLAAKMLGKKTIIHFVGSDAYWFQRENSLWRQTYWRLVVRLSDAVCYVSPHLESMVGREGFILPFPIETEQFKRTAAFDVNPDRDILYYCPSGLENERIYRLSWIINYAREHPSDKITIVGSILHPAEFRLGLPNVEVVPFVERQKMPAFYKRHRKLIRMTSEDGLPRMIHEAFMCGLEVEFNGCPVKDVPLEREPEHFVSSFKKILEEL